MQVAGAVILRSALIVMSDGRTHKVRSFTPDSGIVVCSCNWHYAVADFKSWGPRALEDRLLDAFNTHRAGGHRERAQG